jgi:hypothetical protein
MQSRQYRSISSIYLHSLPGKTITCVTLDHISDVASLSSARKNLVMPSYAVLGATGNTGLALIKVLLQSPDKEINAYCRSGSKLLNLCPQLRDRKTAKVFEGPLDSAHILVDCLRGTRAAFLAVAQSENLPNCTIAQDAARSVIAALRVLQGENAPLPKLIILSSASLEPKFCNDVPAWVHTMLYYAASHVYKDLELAETLLRNERSWITGTTWVKPGGLSHDTQKGHVVSKDHAVTPLSYLDLAAGMLEVADDGSGTYAMSNVAVNPTAKDVAFPWNAPMALVRGLLFHFCPWTFRWVG